MKHFALQVFQNVSNMSTENPFVSLTLQNRRRKSRISGMAESLHIDTDWKKQAQEEKRKLAEAQEKQRAADAAAKAAAPAPAASPKGAGGRRAVREAPVANFASLVNSIVTQTMLYLGELAPQGGESMLNLDMAKYQVDVMGILEDKTRNNLTPEEQHLLDSALYDVQTRFITVASQYI
jgi:septal ring-binding cell division protein DamX